MLSARERCGARAGDADFGLAHRHEHEHEHEHKASRVDHIPPSEARGPTVRGIARIWLGSLSKAACRASPPSPRDARCCRACSGGPCMSRAGQDGHSGSGRGGPDYSISATAGCEPKRGVTGHASAKHAKEIGGRRMRRRGGTASVTRRRRRSQVALAGGVRPQHAPGQAFAAGSQVMRLRHGDGPTRQAFPGPVGAPRSPKRPAHGLRVGAGS